MNTGTAICLQNFFHSTIQMFLDNGVNLVVDQILHDVEVDTSIEDISTCVKQITTALLAKNKSTCATQS